MEYSDGMKRLLPMLFLMWWLSFVPGGAIRLVLVVGLISSAGLSHAELSITEDQKRDYTASLDTPEVKAIREYINDCLSGADAIGYPCEPDTTNQGKSIREQPKDRADGRFALLRIDPFSHGGEVFPLA